MNQELESTPPSSPQFLAARDNPLSMDWVTRLKYRFATENWPWHLERLKKLKFRAAVVGPQGSGKTTLLYELHDQLRDEGIPSHHVFVPNDSRAGTRLLIQAIEEFANQSVLLVDGMERLSLRQRWNLLRSTRRGPGLVVNLHQDCRFPERIPTWIRTRTCPELLANLLQDLGLDTPEIQSAGAIALEQSQGNIRTALRVLYDQFASGRFNKILSR